VASGQAALPSSHVIVFVIHDFNAADEIADDFHTMEISIRDFHRGEVALDRLSR
jgi:hypothetical protein